MESWGLRHPQLDVRSHFNMTLNVSAVRENPWTTQNETRSLIADLKLAQVQTLRTMHVTLGAFSLALALLTVHRIISDAKRAAALRVPLRMQRFSAFRNVHPAETFPLVLACGAVIQQGIFVAVQSTSLHSILSDQCRGLAMITLPAIFLLGIITLVFGIDMAIRALKSERFAPRGTWTTTICIGIISFLVLLSWMPTVAWPMYDRCLGSLIWFPMRYELLMLVMLIILVSMLLMLAAIISIQLMRTADVDPNQRISASRMCYYLVMLALLYILVIPVEVQADRNDFNSTYATSRVAEVALFISGIIIAFVHLFLRVNATRLVIKPISEMCSPSKQKRPKIRFFGPSDLEMNISGPLALQGGRRPDSRQGLIDVGPEKNRYDFDPEYFVRPQRPLTPNSTRSQPQVDPTKWPLPPDPAQTGFFSEPNDGTTGLHRRNKSNYSLFPTRAEDVPRLPATVYAPQKSAGENNKFSKLAMRRQSRRRSSFGDAKSITDVGEAFNFLAKPPPLFSTRHNRYQSTDSSATVQIGLRFSVAPATLAAATYTKGERDGQPPLPRAPLRRDESDSSVETLGLPIQAPTSNSSPSDLEGETLQAVSFPFPSKPTVSSPDKPSSGAVLSPATYLQDQREKLLPPTPRSKLPGQPGPPPTGQLPAPLRPGVSGLRMNPISASSTLSPTSPVTPLIQSSRSNSLRSATSPSPTARIPLGAGTMARSSPTNGWI